MTVPALSGKVDNYGPVSEEREIARLTVRGDLPRSLNGSLYRNGPNPQFAVEGSHWFVGDGMLHAFTLDDGQASYRNRWVRTPKWLAEHDAGRALFKGFGQKLPGAPATATDSGVANTNVVWHGGRLLALEEGHLPTEVDPATLETRGYCDYGRRIGGPFTAHPKIDPATGDMIFFGYNAAGPLTSTVSYGVVDATGAVKQFERFNAPYASMVHDFIVTDGHVLFPILPLTGSMERAMSGRPAYAWEPGKGSCVGVMRRGGSTADIKWFRGEACYVFHVMNAWDEGSRIVAEVMQFEEAPLFPHADGTAANHDKAKARLCRWEFDLSGATDTFTRTYMDDLVGEFPRIDDRRAGFRSEHGWFACENPAGAKRGAFDGLAYRNSRTGKRALYFLPEADATSEPVFVPRSGDAAEGDGWLLAVIWRGDDARSDLAVFNALELDRGPVATVELPCRVPFGFHGNWVSAA